MRNLSRALYVQCATEIKFISSLAFVDRIRVAIMSLIKEVPLL